MNWQLRNVYQTRIGEQPEDCILISGRLHGPDRCICEQCIALEQTAAIVGELLAPGESRRISVKGNPDLYLQVKRHNLEKPHPKRQPASVPRLTRKAASQSRPGVQPAFLDSVRKSLWYR
jgi:hypothetical protein